MGTKNSKKYKCPYCDYRNFRSNLIDHVEDDHEDMIPKNYTPARVVYNSINKKVNGSCMICHKETKWDEKKQRYNTLCENPKCRKEYIEIVRSRMVKKYGTYNLLKDPNFQKKMLENRSISGKYKFEDGGSVGYVGSYEKKFLEFMDKFLHIKSYDIISPGPNIPYMYKGKEHVWITDYIYEPYNLVFDIKDGGDNPNTRDMKEYREKQIAKEKAIAEYGDYNYIRLTDNNFEQLISIFMELKEKVDEEPIIRINESVNELHIISSKEDDNMIQEGLLFDQKDIYYNKDKFDSGETNLCFITGLSGSGKSTMGRNMAGDKIEHYELDDVVWNKDSFTMEQFKEYGNLIYSFFNGKGKKYYYSTKDVKEGKVKPIGDKYEELLINDFVNYSIAYAKSHKDTKFVIEGVWLYAFIEPSKLKDCAVYIKGTSSAKSGNRAVKRDIKNFGVEKHDVKTKLQMMNHYVIGNIKDESKLNRFRKYFLQYSNKESINESYVEDDFLNIEII